MLTLASERPKFFVRCEGPKRIPVRKLRTSDIKHAIRHAQLVCYNFEDTPACRVAWDAVEEISSAFAKQRERELAEETWDSSNSPHASKEFDV